MLRSELELNSWESEGGSVHLQTPDEFLELLERIISEPVGPPCCELATRALHHHWGRTV